jgi:serine/threonine protein kinase
MKPGDRFGRYEILGFLGRGAMGEVFRAHDQVLHRRVALKLLGVEEPEVGPQTSTPAVQSMLREARNAAALTHPNIVALFDVGEDQGRPFLVMELVSGCSLRTYVGGDISVASRLSWLADVARALSAAHRIGLVHRDIKPENVLVSDEGVAKVLDFGIARRDDSMGPPSERNLRADFHPGTQGRSLLAGTPGYMAPELLMGHATDARVDQFAWGVMAYELLSGRSPWGDSPEHLMHALLHVEPQALDAAALGIGAEVAVVVARAMRKSPAARFPTMDALLAALCGTPGGESVQGGTARVQPVEIAATAPATPFEPLTATTASVGIERRGVEGPRTRQRGARIAAATVLVTLAVAGGALVLARPPAPIASASANPPAPPLPSDSGAGVPLPPAAREVSVTVTPPGPPPPASTTTPPHLSPRLAPTHPADPASASPVVSSAPTTPPPSKPAPNCDPPFTLDAEGRKHFKPDCYLNQ